MATVREWEAEYRKLVEASNIFDCNVWWAPKAYKDLVRYTDFDEMLKACEGLGVNGGVVTDVLSVELNNLAGNERLRKLLKGHPNWYGAMVLTPGIFFENDAEDYVRGLMKDGFCAAWIFPKTNGHSTNEYACGPIYETLEKLGLPLMVWHDQVSWAEMDAICSAHPDLNVIALGHEVKFLYDAQEYFSLLRKHKNLYLDSHALVLYQELENLWAVTGRMNVVYSSYFPHANPHFASFRVFNAGIPEQAKQDILSANAARLFPTWKDERA